MIASLPMYLRDETRAATEAFYALIRDALRDHGEDAPDALSHDAPIHGTWGRADLTLGQICSLPYRADFAGKVTLIGAADYGLPGAGPGQYYSVFVVRADDPRDTPGAFANAPLAINEPGSHSGWGAPWLYGQTHGFAFSNVVQTGAHVASAQAVAEGAADIAAIDAVTWALIQRHEDQARDLRVIGRTAASAGLTFITARPDPAPFRSAIAEAITALPSADADTLMLRALIPLPASAYTDLPIPTAPPVASNGAQSA